MDSFLFLHQLAFFNFNDEVIRSIAYLLNCAHAVIGATVPCCGVGNGDVVVLIPVLKGFAILEVSHLVDIQIPPAVAPEEEVLTLQHHLSRGLKEQPV